MHQTVSEQTVGGPWLVSMNHAQLHTDQKSQNAKDRWCQYCHKANDQVIVCQKEQKQTNNVSLEPISIAHDR